VRTRRPRSAAWLASAAIAVAACFEISSPQSGLSSISRLIVPWPAVVVGDSLRDSTGKATPVTVDAFDGKGQLVTDARVTLIALDRGLTVLPGQYVRGDSLRTSDARLVGQVQRGGDVLQTDSATIAVVARPDTVSPAGIDTLAAQIHTYTGFGDTAQVRSAVEVKVLNRALLASGSANAAIRSWIVRYEITERPPGAQGATTAFLSAPAGTPQVVVDTTDPSGVASRDVVLRTSVLNPRTGTQYVKVTVTVRERGQNVAGSPIEVVVPFDLRLP
jgi:hypothetical protein